MSRNIKDLQLDEITEEFLRNECIEMGMELQVDTRQGSIYRDAAEGHIKRTAKFFSDLRMVAEIISLSTCTGEVLDEKLHERGLQRTPPEPTSAKYLCICKGAKLNIGDLVFCGGYFFNVVEIYELQETISGGSSVITGETYEEVKTISCTVIIESEDTGTELNRLTSDMPVLPQVDVEGLTSCTLGELYEPALDAEADESARLRLLNRVSGPDSNGNVSQLRSWCESVAGVGKSRIIPLWNGPGTIKAILMDQEGGAVAEGVVKEVQEFIDPDASGLGEGVASIGQFVTVVSATKKVINISASILVGEGIMIDDVGEEAKREIKEYMRTLAFAEYSSELLVRYMRIITILDSCEGVIDIVNLSVNGGIENIGFLEDEVPVLGEVSLNGHIL